MCTVKFPVSTVVGVFVGTPWRVLHRSPQLSWAFPWTSSCRSPSSCRSRVHFLLTSTATAVRQRYPSTGDSCCHPGVDSNSEEHVSSAGLAWEDRACVGRHSAIDCHAALSRRQASGAHMPLLPTCKPVFWLASRWPFLVGQGAGSCAG